MFDRHARRYGEFREAGFLQAEVRKLRRRQAKRGISIVRESKRKYGVRGRGCPFISTTPTASAWSSGTSGKNGHYRPRLPALTVRKGG
ncbi:MAG: hypothetical protein V3S64_11660 [bacterium]